MHDWTEPFARTLGEYEFIVHPVIVGHGPTLFSGLSERVVLRLVGRRELSSGSVAMRNEPKARPIPNDVRG